VDKKILASTASNIAVDNIVERLAQVCWTKLVRLGHPAHLRQLHHQIYHNTFVKFCQFERCNYKIEVEGSYWRPSKIKILKEKV
jgi:hypothetical protein